MKKMIFHYPLPINFNSKSASGIRPIKMIEAFKRLGYEVIEITGYGKERLKKIKDLKKRILAGEKFDFIYSESSTMPTLLTEKHHLPYYPFLDFNFFIFCKKYGIKIALFYRDIYWLFPEYQKEVCFLKVKFAKFFYKYDLKNYNKLVDIIYLPSIKMAKYIPIISQNKFNELPPGHDEYQNLETSKNYNVNDKIKLIYVGGIGSHYQMHILFKVLKKFQNINLTLCTREDEWQKIKNEYEFLQNIKIIHENGDKLKDFYMDADIALIFVKPKEYWKFAVPLKFYEYIGKEKPIIASKGTLVSDIVENNDIGWIIEYSEEALEKLFVYLIKNKNEIILKKGKILQIKEKHTWENRTKKIIKDLGL